MKIETFKDESEQILWKGKPVKSVFIKEKIFSPFAIFAIIWLMFDIAFMSTMLGANKAFDGMGNMKFFFIPFMIFHLLPVWIYLGNVIFSFASWKNTEYMITDKAIYHLSGIFTTTCNRKTFQEVTNISLHQGIIDKHHNVGDIFVITGTTVVNGRTRNNGINIIDIEDYEKVYKLISKTGRDIFSDTMYPNDLRPKTNHGYNTEYNPNDQFKIDEDDFKIDNEKY